MITKTIIVDDVELAREKVKMLLGDADIEIVAECSNGREAIEAIKIFNPDLVFLDVQMPKIGGFEVVEAIGVENMPAVIFITAYDEFAIRAFDINAIDYLLKPFDAERLGKAVLKAKREIQKKASAIELEIRLRKLLEEVKSKPTYLKRIPVKSANGIHLILIADIDWIGAAGHYIEIQAGSKKHLIRETLTQMEQKLDPVQFVRIHRSTIVNIDRVKSIHPMFNGDQLIILENGTELNLSRTYYEKLFSHLSK